MKIEAVMVCVDYSDYLAWTLPLNKKHFERIVVVTATDDDNTKRICDHNHVECITTDVFFANGAAFNKAAGINAGLKKLALSDWAIHMDSDIHLPPRTREMLQKAELDPECVYGIDRMMCKSFEDFASYMAHPEVAHQNEVFIATEAFPFGFRVGRLDAEGSGYVPIGFFQLWNAAKTGIRDYPEVHTTCARADMVFGLRWPRAKRHLIPEIVAVHLEAEDTARGANWRGRPGAATPFGHNNHRGRYTDSHHRHHYRSIV